MLALLLQLLVVGSASAQAAQVEVVDFDYEPRELQVRPGTEVVWTNTGRDVHTVTAVDGSFDFVLNPGATGSVTFEEDGENPYFCKFHSFPGEDGTPQGMIGTVIVGERQLTSTNLQAQDNVERAIAWSRHGFDDGGSANAFLGRADLFADSLASGGAQGRMGAPLLLTPQNALDGRTRAELDRLGVRTVFILGGENAISAGVEQALSQAGFATRRVAGLDRVGTAVDAARSFFPGAEAAVLARAFATDEPTQAFIDSLGGGAFAAIQQVPVLLTRTEALSGTTRRYLEGQGRAIRTIYVVGGPRAVSDAVIAELEALGVEVTRLGGRDRVETSAVVALAASPEPPEAVAIVDGTSTDAWADGFAAAAHRIPVLLASGDDVARPIPGLLGIAGALDIICGTTVSGEACRRATAAAHYSDFPPSDDMLLALVEGEGGLPAYVFMRPANDAVCLSTFAFDGVARVRITRDGETIADVGPSGLQELGDGFEFLTDLYGCDFGVGPSHTAGLQNDPGAYRVRLDYAEGSVSGTPTELTAFMLAGLSGDQMTEGGNPEALGFQAVIGTGRTDELCVIGFYFGLDTPTAAHIHEGPDGPPVFHLPTPMDFGDGFAAMPPACLTEAEANAEAGTVAAIKAAPEGYWVRIHTEAHPGGAIQGQLFDMMDRRGGSGSAASFQAATQAVDTAGVRPGWGQRSLR